MGITSNDLPDASPLFDFSYCAALEIVNRAIQCAVPSLYTLAVYNLGGSYLINYAPDQLPSTFFSTTREKWNIDAFASGVITSAGDQGTNSSFNAIEASNRFTLGNLQQLKDPWGRRYLAIAQDYGSNLWGLT